MARRRTSSRRAIRSPSWAIATARRSTTWSKRGAKEGKERRRDRARQRHPVPLPPLLGRGRGDGLRAGRRTGGRACRTDRGRLHDRRPELHAPHRRRPETQRRAHARCAARPHAEGSRRGQALHLCGRRRRDLRGGEAGDSRCYADTIIHVGALGMGHTHEAHQQFHLDRQLRRSSPRRPPPPPSSASTCASSTK